MRRHHENRPYRLGYHPTTHRIAVKGPASALRSLLTIPGAEAIGPITDPDNPVLLPSIRENFLAVEAMGAPVSVSEFYQQMRADKLRPGAQCFEAIAHRRKQVKATAGLMPHQEEFIAHAYPFLGTFNASEQGTGKTRTAWELAALWGGRRVLIITPRTLMPQWKAEHAEMWQGSAPLLCLLLTGTLEERRRRLRAMRAWPNPPACAVITNYEAIANTARHKGLLEELQAWAPDLLFCDESWKLKNRTAKVTKAVMKLSAGVRTVLLTGTPIGNDVGDLWSQLRIISERAAPESYAAFMAEFAIMEEVYTGNRTIQKPIGCQNPGALMRRVAPYWYRATKATCLNLPPKRYLPPVRLPLPANTQLLYDAVSINGEHALGATLSLSGARQVELRLQQIAGGFRPVPADAEGSSWSVEPLPDCPKVAWVEEWAADTLKGNPTTRALIWCRFTWEVERVAAALVVAGIQAEDVWGSHILDAEVERIKASFNSRDPRGVQVIVATGAKMAFGHNLPAADWHVYFSHTSSAVEKAQSEDRSDRKGRTQEEGSVTYVELVASGTVDEKILDSVAAKRQLAGQLSVETAASIKD